MTGYFQAVIFELRFEWNSSKSEEDYVVHSGSVTRFNVTPTKLYVRNRKHYEWNAFPLVDDGRSPWLWAPQTNRSIYGRARPSRIEQSTVQKRFPDLPAVPLSACKEVGVHVCSAGPPIRSPRHVYDLDSDLGSWQTFTPETEGRCIYFEKRRLPFPSILFFSFFFLF